MAVGDRVEDGGVERLLIGLWLGIVGVAARSGFTPGQQRCQLPCDVLGQRHLDEDQWIIGHPGVDEGVAAAARSEAVLQVIPRFDGVDRLVLDQLLEERSRGVPRQTLQP